MERLLSIKGNPDSGNLAVVIPGMSKSHGFNRLLTETLYESGQSVANSKSGVLSKNPYEFINGLIDLCREKDVKSLSLIGMSLGGAAAVLYKDYLERAGLRVKRISTLVAPFHLNDLSRGVKFLRAIGGTFRKLSRDKTDNFARKYLNFDMVLSAEQVLNELSNNPPSLDLKTPVLAVTTRSDVIIDHNLAMRSLRNRFLNVQEVQVEGKPVIGLVGVNKVGGHILADSAIPKVISVLQSFNSPSD